MKTNNKTIINILSKIKVMSANEQFLNVVINNGTVYLAHEQGYIELKTELSPDLYGRIPLKRFIDLLKNKIDITQSNLTQDLDIYAPIKNDVDDDFKNNVDFEVNKEFLSLFDFAGKDYIRPAMTGIYLSDEICATNAHILKTIKKDTFKDYNIILPSISLKLLQTEIYTVSHNSRHIQFKNENSILTFNLIDSKYPNFKVVIPQYSELNIKVDKKELLNAVKKCMLFSNKVTGMLILELNGFNFKITGADIDMNLEHTEILNHTSNKTIDFKIGLNGNLLQIVLKNENSNTIEFDFHGNNKPVLINKNNLIMPMFL